MKNECEFYIAGSQEMQQRMRATEASLAKAIRQEGFWSGALWGFLGAALLSAAFLYFFVLANSKLCEPTRWGLFTAVGEW